MGGFHRKIIIVTGKSETGAALARAVLEDDFHNFRVEVTSQEGWVTAIGADAFRFPYSACPDASNQLKALIGKPIGSVSHQVYRQTEARLQCTHMLDLSGLAIAALARSVRHVEYDIHVSDRLSGRYRVHVARGGTERLFWKVEGDVIVAPPAYSGINLKSGFARWALTHLGPLESEAALIARRCAMISIGREKDLDASLHAEATGHCYSQQIQRHRDALRMKGSARDFSQTPAALCASDRDWVAPIQSD